MSQKTEFLDHVKISPDVFLTWGKLDEFISNWRPDLSEYERKRVRGEFAVKLAKLSTLVINDSSLDYCSCHTCETSNKESNKLDI